MQKKPSLYILIFMTFLLFNLSCKTTQLKFDRKYKQNFYSEPKLNEEINQFLKNNGDKILREKSVEDLLDLQSCEKPSNCRYNDFPNDFESILKFNKLLSKEQFVWIHHPDYINLKNNIVKFILKNKGNNEAFQHAVTLLENCRLDNDYLRFLYASSDLY